MLQARIFPYGDAHRYRLGTHYEALPVNAPKCPMSHYLKDGHMRFFPNFPNPDAYYEPNSFRGPVESREFAFEKGQKERLPSNIADPMQGVPGPIVNRQLGLFEKLHPDYAEGGQPFPTFPPPVRGRIGEEKGT